MEYDNDWPVSASVYLAAELPELAPLPNDDLGRAIKIRWRRHHPDYWLNIYGRYPTECRSRTLSGVFALAIRHPRKRWPLPTKANGPVLAGPNARLDCEAETEAAVQMKDNDARHRMKRLIGQVCFCRAMRGAVHLKSELCAARYS